MIVDARAAIIQSLLESIRSQIESSIAGTAADALALRVHLTSAAASAAGK